MREIGNNPDKFHLVATNSAYDVSFTCEPRAADEWLFHNGGPVETNLLRKKRTNRSRKGNRLEARRS